MSRKTLLLETLEDRVLCDAAPVVTLTVPPTALIGSQVQVTASFNNNGGTAPVGNPGTNGTGYAPYIDLVIDHKTNVTGNGGGVDFIVGTNTATYLGQTLTVTKLTFDSNGQVVHPYAVDSTGAPLVINAPPGYGAGDTLLVLQLPFGSFTTSQPIANVVLTLSVSNLAELNKPLNISARGGFQYGNDALNNPATDPSIVGAYQSTTITPQVISLTNTYIGPENETATGPNYIRQYKVDVTIAQGQTLSSLQISDLLPDTMQFDGSVQVLVHGVGTSAYTTLSSPDLTIPGGTLTEQLNSPITGTGGVDATLLFSFYVPRVDSSSGVIVPAPTGSANSGVNTTATANAQGVWNPVDPGDPQGVVAAATPVSQILQEKSIATQESVAIVNDTGAPGASPGDTLQYTVTMQLSDYFAMQNVNIQDTISDGQRLDATYTPTFTWTEHGVTYTAQAFQGGDYTVTPHYSTPGDGSAVDGTDGTTGLSFNLSAEMVARGQDAMLLGGGIPDGGTGAGPLPNNPPLPYGPTTVTVTYRTVIQSAFSDNYPSGNAQLNPRDVVSSSVTASGTVLQVSNLASTGNTASDGSGSSVSIVNSGVAQTIYAINGNTDLSGYIGASGQVLIAPGDAVTYRLEYTLPTGSVENLELTDYLPLPIYDATSVTTFNDTISGIPPVSGTAQFGPSETLRALHGSAPTITTNAAGNSILFNYGTTDNPAGTAKTVDILFTTTVLGRPFADGLILTNQVQGTENNTQQPSVKVSSDAITQVQLQEPSVAVFKGVVGYNSTGLTLGGIGFTAPTASSSFTGIVNDATQAAAIGASDLPAIDGVDGGDTVRYGIVLQNSGRSDAYNVQVGDVVPTGYTVPPDTASMNLTIRRGDGTLLVGGTDYTATVVAGALNISFTDNYTSGNTVGEAGSGALSRGLNAGTGVAITNGLNTLVITYDLTLQTTVPQARSTITNTATLSNYTGELGGSNFVPAGLTDTANVTLASPSLTKVLSGTSVTDTGNNALNQAVIGELVNYTLTLTVPEGETPNVVINDILDAGLAFVDVQSITFSAGLTSANPVGTGTVPTNVVVTSTGHNLAFNFGTLTNNNSSNGVPETVTIVYQAVVLNENTTPAAPGNQTGTALNNAASVSAQYTDVPSGTPTNYTINQSVATANVTVVEPALTVASAVGTAVGGPFNTTLGGMDGGNTIFYRVQIVNAAGSPTAFNTTLTDTLPTSFITGFSLVSVSGGGFTTGDFNITGGVLQTSNPAGIDIAANTTISIILQGTIISTVPAGQQITNIAAIQWTSLSGTPGTLSTYNPSSTERTGAGGIGTDTAVLNNYAKSATSTITDSGVAISKNFQGGSLTADDTSIPTAGSNPLNDVVVGESVIYDILVTMPEGVTQNLSINDIIPTGMRLDLTFNGGTGFQIITSAAASNGQLAADFSDPGSLGSPALTAINGGTLGQDGTDGHLTFGSVTVTADNVATNNSFIIRVRGIVDDVMGNQNTVPTTLTNAAQAVFTNPNTLANTTVNTAGNPVVTVIEPTLSITNTVSSPSGDAGDPVTYTITISNPSLTSQADAYEVTLNDLLPADLISPSIVGGTFSTSGFGGTFTAPVVGNLQIINSGGNNILQIDPAYTLNIPLGGSLTFQVTGTLSNTVQSGQSITNTAQTFWTSTPGTNADERTGTGIPSPTLTTPNPAILDNYAISSSAVVTAVGGPVVSKSIIATSEASTLDNFTTGLHDVAPGEIVTYRITVSLPEGVTPGFTVLDNIPLGMAYVPGSVQLFAAHPDGTLFALNAAQPGTGTAAFNGSGLAAPTVTSSPSGLFTEGTDVQFAFGTITTTGDNNVNNNTFYITYQSVVLDVASNTGLQGAQTTRTNAASYSVNAGAPVSGVIDPGGTTVTLIEPDLGVNKTISLGGVPGNTSGDAGDAVAYSVVISHQSNSLAEAFDTTFSDAISPLLGITNISQVTVTHSTLGDVTNLFEVVNVGGNYVLQTKAGSTFDLALGEHLTITATGALTGAVTPNQTIDSTASINYNGLHDAAAPAFNPSNDVTTDHERAYTASDNAPVQMSVATLTKQLFATSEPNTTGSNVAIGETVTYALEVTLPEGTTPNFTVVDNLPVGLQYVSSSLVTTAAASGGLLSADYNGTLSVPVITGGATDGAAVTFSFGSTSTTGDNVTTNNSFIILVTARVVDEVSNVGTTGSQTVLHNTASLTVPVESLPTVTTPNVNVTVVEPRLQIVKSVNDSIPNIGETLNYTLVITHTASSTEDAFNVIINDFMPTGLSLDTASIKVNGVAIGSSGLVTSGSNASTSSQINFQLDTVALGQTVTITYNATVAQTQSLAGTTLNNNARIYWDSLAANDGNNSVLTGIPDAGSGERDFGATPGYTEAPTPGINDPAQDTEQVTLSAATITGVVYQDVNSNGVYNAGVDAALDGVTVTITGTDLNGNAYSATTVTAGGGLYSFTGLPAGVYTLTETQPVGYTDALETVGTNFGGSKSDALGSNTISTLTVLSHSNLTGVGYNFGEVLPSTLSGSVYSDLNNDGTRQGGETGISGVAVRLTGTDVYGQSVTIDATTNGTGGYTFDNGGAGLRPGTYVVTELAQPSGYLDGRDTAGTNGGNSVAINDQISGVVLSQNITATSYLFGELLPASLGGFVYDDANNDGIKQVGEAGISGVTVTLTGTDDLGHAVNISTITDATGAYDFTTLRPGTYSIAESQPVAYLDGKDTQGTPGAGVASNDLFSNIPLTAATDGVNNNFGELTPSSLAGRVFNDANNDGIQNGTDAGIAGVTVTLTGTDDLGHTVNTSTTTDVNGNYSFNNLRLGSYVITETQPAGLLDGKNVVGTQGGATVNNPLSDTITAITLSTDGVNGTGNNFAELNPASLSGFVYDDANNDGVKQGGEVGIAGVTVTLTGTDDLGNAVNISTVTDVNGAYGFTNLRPGTYGIAETQPVAYLDGKETLGTGVNAPNNAGTVGADLFSGISLVNVGTGNNAGVNYNFGELTPSTLSGNVFLDLNNNGVRDGFESDIPNVPLTLSGTDDLGHTVLLTTTTALDGSYSFGNLRPGLYVITETQPTGYANGQDTAGSQGGNVSVINVISAINLSTDAVHGTGNNFAELFDSTLTKSLVGSSESSTSGANLTIGETGRFRLVATVPYGTLSDFQITDALPAGLQFMNDGTATVGFVSATGTLLTSSSVSGGGMLTVGAPSVNLPGTDISTSPTTVDHNFQSGGNVYFKLGTLTNSETNLANVEYVVIEFNAVVVNQSSNQAGTTLPNSFSLRFDQSGGGVSTAFAKQSNTVVTDVVEPILALDKEVTGGPTTPQKGDTMTYTLTITQASGSGSTAWDTLLTDSVPAGMTITSVKSVVLTGGVVESQAVSITGGGTGISGVFDIPVGGSVQVTYTALVTNTDPAVRTLTNVADVKWSTVSGTSSFERKSGDSLLNGGGLNDYELTVAKTIPLNTFNYDTINNFSQPPAKGSQLWVGPVDIYRKPLIAISPIYSGEAEPGSTLVVTLYNANGGNVGSAMVVTDFGGNWLADFPSTVVFDYPTSIQITQQSSFGGLVGSSGNNLRTYFASAINQSHFSMETLRSSDLNESRIMPLLENFSLQYPIGLGNAKYGYEFLANSGSVSD